MIPAQVHYFLFFSPFVFIWSTVIGTVNLLATTAAALYPQPPVADLFYEDVYDSCEMVSLPSTAAKYQIVFICYVSTTPGQSHETN